MTGSRITRRQFIGGSATVAGGLVLGISFANGRTEAKAALTNLQPNAWLQITPDNQVIFQLDKAEMGQGVITALPTIIAEELEIDPRKIRIELAQIHDDFQNPLQITGGSSSVRTRWDVLRETGAKARTMLIAAAAADWGVAPEMCYAKEGRVWRKDTGQAVTFGDVADGAARQELPDEVSLKDPVDFRYVGKSLRRFDSADKSTGEALFGIDFELDG
ncbi:MAG: xanthine dehydrogenase family protein molybdopterin-binding subunit, partial [Pseudomonadales bacterium]|nr:xanthine dehydrogenase family protein molybdopterin-binding subunit [Pseudomonadales bacterium]